MRTDAGAAPTARRWHRPSTWSTPWRWASVLPIAVHLFVVTPLLLLAGVGDAIFSESPTPEQPPGWTFPLLLVSTFAVLGLVGLYVSDAAQRKDLGDGRVAWVVGLLATSGLLVPIWWFVHVRPGLASSRRRRWAWSRRLSRPSTWSTRWRWAWVAHPLLVVGVVAVPLVVAVVTTDGDPPTWTVLLLFFGGFLGATMLPALWMTADVVQRPDLEQVEKILWPVITFFAVPLLPVLVYWAVRVRPGVPRERADALPAQP